MFNIPSLTAVGLMIQHVQLSSIEVLRILADGPKKKFVSLFDESTESEPWHAFLVLSTDERDTINVCFFEGNIFSCHT